MNCDNDSSMGRGISLNPQCYKGIPRWHIQIKYNDVEMDTCILCDNCLSHLKKDCRKHGYRVSSAHLH